MTTGALTVVTYVWHYIVGRLVYDQLLRPAIHGHVLVTLLICAVAAAAFVLGRWSGRRPPHGGRP